jgi:hypothetical protein
VPAHATWRAVLVLTCLLPCAASLAAAHPSPTPAGAARVQAPLTLARYVALLEQVRLLVGRAEHLSGPPSAGTPAAPVAHAALLLRRAGPVGTGAGSRVVPDNAAVLGDLAARPPRLAHAAARLDALLAELRSALSAGHGTNDGRAALDAVFRQPPFSAAGGAGPLASIWLRVGQWLDRLLRGLQPDRSPAPLGRFVQVLVIAASAVAVAVMVVAASRGLFHTLVPAASAPGAPLLDHDSPLDAPSARRRAADLGARGAYRDALRYQFLAILLDLDARDLLRVDAAAAGRDLIRQARGRDRLLGDLLAEATRAFETVWFGHQPCEAADYAAMEALAARLAGRAEAMAKERA